MDYTRDSWHVYIGRYIMYTTVIYIRLKLLRSQYQLYIKTFDLTYQYHTDVCLIDATHTFSLCTSP